MNSVAFLLLALFLGAASVSGLLHVQRNEKRSFDALDGLWTFVREPFNTESAGLQQEWFKQDLSRFENATVVPVPCAFNDLFTDKDVRDHTGWVWYQTRFRLNAHDRHSLMKLRFGSVQYLAKVYLNEDYLGEHEGGHLPFEFDVDPVFHKENVLTVAVNNTLSFETVPQASFDHVKTFDYRGVSVGPEFDFFNYAGILRPVYLVKLPVIFVQHLRLTADAQGRVEYSVELNQKLMPEYGVAVAVYKQGDSAQNSVYNGSGVEGKFKIDEKKIDLWWPRGLGQPHLYIFEITVLNVPKQKSVDVYRESFGFRSVHVTASGLQINGKPFYCAGFGMHEDFDLIGRGFSQAVMTKDLNMVEWMNGNCFRTSHYPYSEERMYEADRRGIVVIDEVPAVALISFGEHLLQKHRQMVQDLYERDHRHPSVIVWSLANEPNTAKKESRPYFKSLVSQIKALDSTRPVTIVLDVGVTADVVGDLVDLICLNRYYGWYINHGHLESVNASLVGDIVAWRAKYGKPMVLSEYGAEGIQGLSTEPSAAFSVQYQVQLLEETHKSLDLLRKAGHMTGEMVWNFADFMTIQSLTRVNGNHKGVLTRDRQPKAAAYLLKERYASILKQIQKKRQEL